MDSVGAIIGALVLAIALIGGVGVAQYALADGNNQQTVTEDFDPSTATAVELNESNRDGVYYASTVNVTDENGSLMQPGTDYAWDKSNGTLEVLAGGGLDGDTTATVEYTIRIPSQQQESYATLIGQVLNANFALPLVLVIAVVIGGAATLSSLS